LAAASEVPMALVGLVDFRDPDLPERLDIYRSFSNLTAVRQHLGWDEHNPLRRFAPRPDLMKDPEWLGDLNASREKVCAAGWKCSLHSYPIS
jgi:hypothetical protein